MIRLGQKIGEIKKISPAKISNRDEKEFERLFTTYFIKLAKYAYRYVSNVAVAEDLTQSVFLRIWELNGAWNPSGPVKSYLYRAIRNKCLNHIRHNKVVKKWQEERIQTHSQVEIDMEWDEDKKEVLLDQAIRDAISRMPRKRREVFELSRDEGLSYQEIAEIMGIARKTVENHMGLALQFLKDELSDWT